MRLDDRRHALLVALGHRPLRLATRDAVDAVPAEPVAVDATAPTAAGLSPALARAIARAGRIAPAALPAWLSTTGIDPATPAGKRALWPLLRARRKPLP